VQSPKRKPGATPPPREFNEVLLRIAIMKNDHDEGMRCAQWLDTDLSMETPPQLTMTELNQVLYAAKMELARVMRARVRAKRAAKSGKEER
jgi:hypothetical protein